MDLLMKSIFQEKTIIVNDVKEPSVLMGMCDETSKYIEDVEPRFHIDEDVPEDDKYKWYEIIDGEKVRRNNIDPNMTPDGILTIDKQFETIEKSEIENIKQLSEEELLKKHRREMLQRIRCIALNAMKKNILSNPKQLSPSEKREFVKRVEELYILSEDEIKIMFGEICHDTIFQIGSDYSNYVVYDV